MAHLGCTAQASEVAAVSGDDLALNNWMLAVDLGHPSEMLRASFQHLGTGESALRRTRLLINALTTMPWMVKELIAAHHHERLDGSGYHHGIPATLIPMTVRILAAADTITR